MIKDIRILILDEDRWSAEHASRELQRAGGKFTCTRVDTWDDLLREISASEIDIILSEYQLPGVSVNDVLALLTTPERDIPIILYTSAANEDAAKPDKCTFCLFSPFGDSVFLQGGPALSELWCTGGVP